MPEKSASVSAEQIRALREQTGAGILECKRALAEAGGRMEEAVKLLRARGNVVASERASREARQGLIGSYVHGGRIGVLVEVNCETDFVARTDALKQLVLDLCLQVASMNPRYVSREEVPPEEIGQEGERVLLDQAFVRDSAKTVQDRLAEVVQSTRENVVIRRFVRIALGEISP